MQLASRILVAFALVAGCDEPAPIEPPADGRAAATVDAPPRVIDTPKLDPRPLDRYRTGATEAELRRLVTGCTGTKHELRCPELPVLGGSARFDLVDGKLDRVHVTMSLADDDEPARRALAATLGKLAGYGPFTQHDDDAAALDAPRMFDALDHAGVRLASTGFKLPGPSGFHAMLMTTAKLPSGTLSIWIYRRHTPPAGLRRHYLEIHWRPPWTGAGSIFEGKIPGFERTWAKPPEQATYEGTENDRGYHPKVSVTVTPCDPCDPVSAPSRGALAAERKKELETGAADPRNRYEVVEESVGGRRAVGRYVLSWSTVDRRTTSYQHRYELVLRGAKRQLAVFVTGEHECWTPPRCSPMAGSREQLARVLTRAELRAAGLAVAVDLASKLD